MFDYLSTSSVWVRQAWLFEYLGDNYHQLLIDKEAYLCTNLQNAYKMSLAPRHPWLLSKMVLAGHLTSTSKACFIDNCVNP